MPIVGSFAGASARAYGLGAGGVLVGDFESIQTITVGSGGAANIEFTSIPATYTHLQLRGLTRTNRASDEDIFKMRFNSDTTETNYYNHYLEGSTTAIYVGASNQSWIGLTTSATMTANTFGGYVIDILDYANTNKFKTTRALGCYRRNAGGTIWINSHLWKNTNAISTITFVPNLGTNFAQYSTFALYGIKG
jgi:hypothetical protein